MKRNQTLKAVQRGPPTQDDNKQNKARSHIETALEQLASALEQGKS